jgi:hypothetical protein
VDIAGNVNVTSENYGDHMGDADHVSYIDHVGKVDIFG